MADPVAFEFETAKQLMRLLKKSKDGVFNSEVDDSIPLDHAPAFIWAYVPATVTCTYDSTVKAWIIGGATTCYPINSGVDAAGLMQWGKNDVNGIVTGGITCTTFTPKMTSGQSAPVVGKGFYLGTIFAYNSSEQPRVLIGLPPVSGGSSSSGSAVIDVVTDVQCGPEGLSIQTVTISGADYDNAVIRNFLALNDVTQKSYVANQGRCVVVNAAQTGLEFGPVVGENADTFIGLTDSPESYGTTNTYKVLTVSSTNAGVSFSDNNITTQFSIKGGGNPNNPATYAKLELVGDVSTPTANNFYGVNGSSVRGWYQVEFTSLKSVPNTFTGQAGKFLKVNSGATALEFSSASVETQYSVTSEAGKIQLVNDADSPGANKYYGTDSNGVKGWYSLSSPSPTPTPTPTPTPSPSPTPTPSPSPTPTPTPTPFAFVSQSGGASYSGTGSNSGDQLSGSINSYGTAETLQFTAGSSGTLNYYISGYDMMGDPSVYISLAVNGATVASTGGGPTYTSGTTAVTSGQSVLLTFVGSSMAYSSFQIWMS